MTMIHGNSSLQSRSELLIIGGGPAASAAAIGVPNLDFRLNLWSVQNFHVINLGKLRILEYNPYLLNSA